MNTNIECINSIFELTIPLPEYQCLSSNTDFALALNKATEENLELEQQKNAERLTGKC